MCTINSFFFFKIGSRRELSIPIDQIEFHCTYVSTLPRGALPSCTYLREDKINATAVRALKWQHVSRYMFILSSVTLHWLKYCEVLLYNLWRRECVNWQEKKGGAGGMKRNLRIEARKKKRKGKRKRKRFEVRGSSFFRRNLVVSSQFPRGYILSSRVINQVLEIMRGTSRVVVEVAMRN